MTCYLGSFLWLVFNLVFQQSYGLRHSTKTAYLDSFTQEQFNYINNVQNYKIQNCVPEQVYIFLRHGSRYPNSKYPIKLKQFLEYVQNFRNEQRKKRNIPTTVIDELFVTFENTPNHGLSELGGLEMRNIAQRFKSRFPSLFNMSSSSKNLNEILSDINISTSNKSRCIDSSTNFITGLYENDKQLANFLKDNLIFNDTLIRYFDYCERYLIDVKENKSFHHEITKFKRGQEMTNILNRIKEKNDIMEMEFDISLLSKIYGLCGIEYAHRMNHNWCKLFEKDDYEILSYLSDLKDYWLKSYGNELNSKVVQYLFKDLFDHMDKHIKNDTDKRKILLRFGHAENIIPIITALGLFKNPKELRYDNYEENKERLFKAEIFSPFAANVAFVLHKCTSDSLKFQDIYDQYKVNILINELPVHEIKAGKLMCSDNQKSQGSDSSWCHFKNFKAQMNEFLNDDPVESCKVKKKIETINPDDFFAKIYNTLIKLFRTIISS